MFGLHFANLKVVGDEIEVQGDPVTHPVIQGDVFGIDVPNHGREAWSQLQNRARWGWEGFTASEVVGPWGASSGSSSIMARTYSTIPPFSFSAV